MFFDLSQAPPNQLDEFRAHIDRLTHHLKEKHAKTNAMVNKHNLAFLKENSLKAQAKFSKSNSIITKEEEVEEEENDKTKDENNEDDDEDDDEDEDENEEPRERVAIVSFEMANLPPSLCNPSLCNPSLCTGEVADDEVPRGWPYSLRASPLMPKSQTQFEKLVLFGVACSLVGWTARALLI